MTIPMYKQTNIKGCSLYKGINGVFPAKPCALDCVINSPTITFASTDVSLMGTYSAPDVTRIENCQLTVEVEANSPDTRPLFSAGLQEWMIVSITGMINAVTRLEEVVRYTIFATGSLAEIPSVELSPGSEGKITLTMNCMSYKKIDQNNVVIDHIDRINRTVIIGGEDFSTPINQLL